MEFANANKVYRKSGRSPTNAFTEETPGTATALSFVIPRRRLACVKLREE
jgi:hypothetical protein